MPVHCLRAAALAAALLPAAWAGAAPLSLDEALALAVQRRWLTARFGGAGAQGAAEMARAGQQPDPMLSVGIENLLGHITGPERLSTTAEGMTMKRIAIAGRNGRVYRARCARSTGAGDRPREALMEPVVAAEARLQTARWHSHDARYGRARRWR